MSEKLIEFLSKKAEGDALSIVNIRGGAGVEFVDNEIRRCLENINDINTGVGTRKVNLEISITPSENDRTFIKIGLNCGKTKLAGPDPIETTADIRLDANGRAIAHERDPQIGLPFGVPKNVTSIGGKK